eukprot:gnl/TRDRNA2_/TRDRNA2_51414_c0_seq1.p1 gnl/TRDRNA2_/TRDRNA2_51414_c0~~gnl/TRDRNA2_/TRDRNA2_51414_c0_seq1.p1  ORF type:complete len:382 (+),score=69.94 gnl/TRDRNA2_/TRDRNA2_51414_c0_seq1:48-1193(+)
MAPAGQAMVMFASTCRLEIMGMHDTAAYRRHASGFLREALSSQLFSGLNVPNKKPGEPLLEWAAEVSRLLPECDLCVHYSLKHQPGGYSANPSEHFAQWCQDAVAAGVHRVLLVTGPRGPKRDAIFVLEQLARQHHAAGLPRLGVAFNACLPTEAERETERKRLVRKLRTHLVKDVWLNCGCDTELLAQGTAFVQESISKLGLSDVSIFGSVLLPNNEQLIQMRARPWNGVHFSEEFLSSVDGMTRATSAVVSLYQGSGVEPIVESKVRSAHDLQVLGSLLKIRKPESPRLGAGQQQSTYYPPKGNGKGGGKASAVEEHMEDKLLTEEVKPTHSGGYANKAKSLRVRRWQKTQAKHAAEAEAVPGDMAGPDGQRENVLVGA